MANGEESSGTARFGTRTKIPTLKALEASESTAAAQTSRVRKSKSETNETASQEQGWDQNTTPKALEASNATKAAQNPRVRISKSETNNPTCQEQPWDPNALISIHELDFRGDDMFTGLVSVQICRPGILQNHQPVIEHFHHMSVEEVSALRGNSAGCWMFGGFAYVRDQFGKRVWGYWFQGPEKLMVETWESRVEWGKLPIGLVLGRFEQDGYTSGRVGGLWPDRVEEK